MNWSHGRSQSHTVQNIRNPDKSQFKGLFRNMKWIFLNKKLEPILQSGLTKKGNCMIKLTKISELRPRFQL